MEKANPAVRSLTCKPSCLEGGPEFVMLFKENDLVEEVEEEFEEEEEDDDLEAKDVSSVIDPLLGGIVFGKPFVKESKLIYDKEERTVMFEKNDERVTFKMPHKMESIDRITQMVMDCAVGRLRKMSVEEAWNTIEELVQYEEEEWDDPIFLEKEASTMKTLT
ncbi:hypothetical protein Tco_1474772 [Tanacetum coccineum]